jgi:hypothetical protein
LEVECRKEISPPMLLLDERTAWKEMELLDGDRERRGWVWRSGCSLMVFMVV